MGVTARFSPNLCDIFQQDRLDNFAQLTTTLQKKKTMHTGPVFSIGGNDYKYCVLSCYFPIRTYRYYRNKDLLLY